MTEPEMRFEIARLAGILAALEGGYAPKTVSMLRRIASRLGCVPERRRSDFWTSDGGANTREMLHLRASSLSFAKIAKLMGKTSNSVMSRYNRVTGKTPRPGYASVRPNMNTWSETALTETWADRKIRLAKERADVHAND